VTIADQIARRLKGSVKVVEAYFIELQRFFQSHHVVAECNEGHMNAPDLMEQIRISRSRENNSVNQAVLLKNGRQVDPIGQRSR